MEDNQYIERNSEEEIDLRDLFMALWKRKVMIVSITLIAAIITGLISVFMITPVYHSRLNIIINMPESYYTKYGNYALPISTNEQYVNLITSADIIHGTIEDMGYSLDDTTIENLRDRIICDIPEAKANIKQNSFYIKVSADNPAEAKKLADVLYDNYIKYLDFLVIEGALEYYTDSFNISIASLEVSLKSNKEILAKNEALLAETPQTINQKDAMEEIQSSDNISDYIILERIINPNYTKIEQDIIVNKQSINDIENSMRVYNEYLVELDAIRDKVDNYKKSGEFVDFPSDVRSVTKTNVYLASSPIEPSRKTSPSNSKNAIIGALLGGVVAVLIALIKEYWLEPEKKKN